MRIRCQRHAPFEGPANIETMERMGESEASRTRLFVYDDRGTVRLSREIWGQSNGLICHCCRLLSVECQINMGKKDSYRYEFIPAGVRVNQMDEKNDKIKKMISDSEVLAEFINIYCSDKHSGMDKAPAVSGGAVGDCLASVNFEYCDECRKLLLHAVSKRILCPYDPKPSCKHCPTHCYGPGYRERIQEVMRYSGMRLIKKGRFGLIKKYFS